MHQIIVSFINENNKMICSQFFHKGFCYQLTFRLTFSRQHTYRNTKYKEACMVNYTSGPSCSKTGLNFNLGFVLSCSKAFPGTILSNSL